MSAKNKEYYLIAFTKKGGVPNFYSVAAWDKPFFKNTIKEVESEITEFHPDDRQDMGVIYYIDLNKKENAKINNELVLKVKKNTGEAKVNTSDFSKLPSNSELKKKSIDLKYFATQQDNYIIFQAFNKNNIVGERLFSLKSRQMLDGEDFIILREDADVIYNAVDNKIFFEKITAAKRIFSGLTRYQREASIPEVEIFLMNEKLKVSPELTPVKISLPNKKRIAETLENQADNEKKLKEQDETFDYNKYYENDLKKCMGDIKKYYPSMIKGGKVVIENNKDLEHFIHALNERLYTTSRSKEQRIATAVRKKDS
jgi:hypothetical protein